MTHEILQTPEEFSPKLLKQGKTKRIWSTEIPGIVEIESKDDMTAGDGIRHDIIPGKAPLAAETAVNVFKVLEKEGIETHLTGDYTSGSTKFSAVELSMVPIEIVVRNKAYGSYLQRFPDSPAGFEFDQPVVEFFLKSDENHDPLIERDYANGIVGLWDAHKPNTPTPGVIRAEWTELIYPQDEKVVELGLKINSILKPRFAKLGVDLADFKFEVGRPKGEDRFSDNLIVGDVIDNESWRAILEGEDLSKQYYRDIGDRQVTHEEVQKLIYNFTRMTLLTREL